MAVIKPTFSLVSNASTATTDSGPLSVALSLSATDSLTVDVVQSKIVTFANATSNTILWDGDAIAGADGAGGTRGGFLYFKNTSANGTSLVYIGIDHDGGTSLDLSTADEGDAEADLSQMRLFTLKYGEFAWMPFDGNCDIFGDASAAATLECWYFDRG
jgi:hypothetical protein